jgi:peroxiredoxin Q/BCP
LSKPPDAGDLAPDFKLPDQYGNERSLSDFRGRSLVLFFFPRAETPG